MTRYVLDTNLYIDAIRGTAKAAELERYYEAFLPRTHLSAVVVLELLAGARPGKLASLERDLIAPFERRGRVLVPSYRALKRAASVLAALAGDGSAGFPRGLVNDAILAASCREAGMVLVSSNIGDFARIRAHLAGFEYVPPWPRLP